jgi:hypothetical protein
VLTRSASRPAFGSDSAGLRHGAAAAALALLLFAGSWVVLHVTPLGDRQIIDTPVYQRYGDAVLDGQVPYRDFSLEYPPGALPVFILPSLAPQQHYRSAFETLMVLCGLTMVALVAFTLVAMGAGRERVLLGSILAGIAPLALGSVILTRYDLWPAMLTVGALCALVSGRDRLGFGVLGLAAAAKLWPALILPLAVVYVSRRSGGRTAVGALAVFLAVLAVAFIPFAVLSPGGLADSFSRQMDRPLQIESLGSSLLLAAHQVGDYEPTVVSSFGSQNLAGGLPDSLATVLTIVQVLAVIALWILFATRRGYPEELTAASAAVVAAFIAFGKVLSPQFLIWLLPLVPLVLGGLGLVAAGLFVLVLVLTQLWFPRTYWELVAFDAGPSWLLLARDLALVALVAVLAAAIGRVGGRTKRGLTQA